MGSQEHRLRPAHTTPKKSENRCFTLQKHQLFHAHSTPEKFENRCFTLQKLQLLYVHTTLEKFENHCFKIQKHQFFYVHTTPERNLKTQQLSIILDLCLKRTRAGKLHEYNIVTHYFCIITTHKLIINCMLWSE